MKDTLIYGTRAVIEAIESGKTIDKLMIQKGLSNALTGDLFKACRDNNIPYQLVPPERVNRETRANHQGVIAFMSAVEYQNIEEIIMRCNEKGEIPLLLMLDGITDVRNFGAIARTANCAGVHAIIIPSRGGAMITADAIKTSAGALHTSAVCKVDNLKATLYLLKEYGIQIVSCTEKTDSLYTAHTYTQPTAIIMGAEDSGISNELIKLSDVKAKLPLLGNIESLNVSVACGVLLYEVVRQRGQ
ncbi:MAG: 23S rRNA (guanosine(2251)-2'-O)-methyltransferase RlmB [Bacteroidia bacterium]|nr:23S rRNA (guanosine(2251)-2'-O)-methyltransferase RlmB [Bacteroidia bacterium]